MSYEEDDNDYGPCSNCGWINDDPWQCKDCDKPFCHSCHLPEDHDCENHNNEEE